MLTCPWNGSSWGGPTATRSLGTRVFCQHLNHQLPLNTPCLSMAPSVFLGAALPVALPSVVPCIVLMFFPGDV